MFNKEKMNDMIEDFKYDVNQLWRRIKNFPHNLVCATRRSLRWFIRAWHCYEWDYAFLLQVMEWKMEDMIEHWENKKNIMIIEKDRKRIIKEMKECLEILKRYGKDDYFKCKEYKDVSKKWGKLVHKKIDALDKNGNNCYSLNHANVKNKKDDRQASNDYHKVYLLMEKKRVSDREKFFELLQTRMEGWWD